tara:strand:+ start:973 stop:1350 length:378 start_codon:yes stop_codon:yes gene_type:complete
MCKQDISSTAQPMPELTPEHRLEAEVLHYQQAGDTILQNVVPSNLLVKRLNQEDHSIAHQVRPGLRTALLGFGLFTRQTFPNLPTVIGSGKKARRSLFCEWIRFDLRWKYATLVGQMMQISSKGE